MVKLGKIYTRGGDKGETSLVGGKRLAKHDARVAAYGTVDETNAAIGMARLHTKVEGGGGAGGKADAMLARIQDDLFDLGADLATEGKGDAEDALRIVPEQVARLEREIDSMNEKLSPLDSFTLPGGTPAAAALHVARTVCRRAERGVTALAGREAINPEALKYINRLSDHLFVLARTLNDGGRADVLWRPGANR
ncbi:MAG: cob(I)yrinic acid a,c-diamide adenosyltransferase [Proteobacteria bacterium]|nr:cob(I)yrinic acid a,c-diamide adenosyltransferase [Pseudomonadota bacterium]